VLHDMFDRDRATTRKDRAMTQGHVEAAVIGWVESPLTDLADAPRQGDEGAPEAWLVFHPDVAEGMSDLAVGERIIIVTWLDRGRRDVLRTHPRNDADRPAVGVFSTRSPDRPNPIGLHPVQILAIDGRRVQVSGLEALDGTPFLDVKPVLLPLDQR
jgi:tRNA-Thr(GGU) m(6)t(6)A37 methyltransferase TsaA